MLLAISGEVITERMKRRSQSKKKNPVVYVTGDGSKKFNAEKNNIA